VYTLLVVGLGTRVPCRDVISLDERSSVGRCGVALRFVAERGVGGGDVSGERKLEIADAGEGIVRCHHLSSQANEGKVGIDKNLHCHVITRH